MQEALGEQVSRRGFIELSAGALAVLSGGGGVNQQLSNPLAGDGNESPIGLDDDVDGAGILLGPLENRPDPDDPEEDYFDQWHTYHFVYVATTDYGGISWIKHTDPTWQDVPMNPQTQIDEVRVTQFESFFNHTFARPEAPDTKNWDFDDADITKQGSEVELAATTTLESSQRGNYPPGGESIPGVAWRVTDAVTGGECFAGYFIDSDGDNIPDDGFGFGMDTDGTFTFIAKDGTLRRVYQGDWNGEHDVDTDPFRLHFPRICRFPHLFYGGGSIAYRLVDHTDTPATKLKTVHIETPETAAESGAPFDDGPPISQPNLPVNFVTNGLAGGSLRANASHYERGQTEGETRVNGEHFNVTGIGTTGWTPLISWQKRSGWDMVNVRPLEFKTFAATNDLKLELQLDSDLTGTSFGLPTNSSSSETAVEVDTAGSISADGERRAVDTVAAGQGSKFGGSGAESLEFNLAVDTTVTLAAQAVGGEADAFGHLEWREFF